MQSIIAIDPGEVTGWAVFLDGKLAALGVAAPGGNVLDQYLMRHSALAPIVVIEEPRVVPGTPSARDIVRLSMTAGRWLERAYLVAGVDAELVTPSAWKGQVPKQIHHKRIVAALDADELRRVEALRCAASKVHNAIDAVGLGLWRLARLSR
jgi:hypothetical protein